MSAVILIDDTFVRANGAPGNGWVDLHGGRWAIASNKLVGTADGSASPIDHGYDILRPAGEDRLDQKVSATVPIAGTTVGNGWHAIPIVRHNRTTGDQYFAALDDASLLIATSIGGVSAGIATIGYGALTVGHSIKLELTASGSNPTTLTATATDVTSSTLLNTVSVTNSSPTLQAAGAAGVGLNGGVNSETVTYAEFVYSDLDGATLYTLTPGVSSVHPAVAQTFSVLPNGSFIGTITPHVTGSAVASPTSIAYAGENTAKTFTVTDAVAEVVTVSATNSASLTNPGNAILTVARKRKRGGAMAMIRRAKMAASFQLPPRS